MATRKSVRTCPGFFPNTTTRSASVTASSMLWVTMNTARVGIFLPSHNSSSSERRFSAVSTSSAEKGSSMKSTSGSTTSARAKPTRCLMPPESSLGYACSKPSRPTESRIRSARLMRSVPAMPRALAALPRCRAPSATGIARSSGTRWRRSGTGPPPAGRATAPVPTRAERGRRASAGWWIFPSPKAPAAPESRRDTRPDRWLPAPGCALREARRTSRSRGPE